MKHPFVVAAIAACTVDLDCSLNGRCVANTCVCYAGWTGASCSALHLAPAPTVAAYGGGVGSGLSSWGAGVAHDPASGQYVMYVDEISQHCGLGVWQPNSHCVLATAATAAGPFVRQRALQASWCHGSSLTFDAASGLWFFGKMTHSAPQAACKICSNGTTPAGAPDGPCDPDSDALPYGPTAFWARAPGGPFMPAPGFLNCGNGEAFFNTDGSVVFACPTGSATTDSFFSVARAPSAAAALAGNWSRLPQTLSVAGSNTSVDYIGFHWEDQTIWRDPRGYFHALMHAFRGQNTTLPEPGCNSVDSGRTWAPLHCTSLGGHAFSLDASHWWVSQEAAYTAQVTFEDGAVLQMRARERPHVILGDDGELAFFLSAVGDPGAGGNTGVPSADHSFTLVQPAMRGVRVSLRDSPGDNPLIEPWAYLNGGNFSGPPVPSSPDPLVSYRWFPSANTTLLQCYDVLPASAALFPGTPPASFSGLPSLSTGAPHVVVSGAGSFWVDFGVESPAWLEVDTAAPLPPGDVALISLGLSESTSPLPNKWRTPTPHGLTLRLETNAQLYEGLRCGFFNMSAPPSAPFTITAVRAVAQAKPVNYTGAFSAPGAPLLERLWYTAVYGVRANLELAYFGAVLVDRGDRISWTGDAYIAQGTALVAFNNFDFVLKNLLHTASECNGIASYCVYWTLAAADYLAAAGNGTTAALLAPAIDHALAAADTNAFALRPDLGSFYGWDDRLGGGFQNASTDEAAWDFRFLVVRALGVRAGTLAAAGNASGAAFWAGRAAAGTAWLRNALGGAAWATGGALGVHAAAEALAAPGFAQPGEAAAALSATLSDAATICSLSPFNTFFILEGLAAAGAVDKGVAVAERCWGGMLALGATCFWEVFSPEWALFMRRGPSEVLWGYNGNTSMCHPWSSGVAQWLTRHVAGLRAEAGGTRVRAAPHLPPALAAPARGGRAGAGALAAALPLPGGGAAALRVAPEGVEVDSPVPVSLVLSEVLLARLGWARGGALRRGGGGVAVEVGGVRVVLEAEEGESGPLWEEGGPLAGSRSAAAVLRLPPGATRVVRASPLPAATTSATTSAAAEAPVFPPLSWPARLVQFDTWTRGSWRGVYGGAGHILFNYKGGDAVALPSWVASWQIIDGYARSWAREAGDARALLDDPVNASAPGALGFYQCGQNSLPQFTFGVDVALAPGAEGRWWQAALYLADFDGAARRNVVEVKSGWPSLNPIAPPQLLEGFEGGVWLVYQLNTSARFRVSQMPSTCPGHTAVASAIVFDDVV